MKLTILTVGRKHEPWVAPGIERFLTRLRAPFAADMVLVPHSSHRGERARHDESTQLLARLKPDDFVLLLDERGHLIDSPTLSNLIIQHTHRHIVIIIGGAYGVTPTVRTRANNIIALSRLVFPHQLVRLLIAEQLYRAQEIYRGSRYHHD